MIKKTDKRVPKFEEKKMIVSKDQNQLPTWAWN